MDRTDKDLMNEFKEFSTVMSEFGLEQVKTGMMIEAGSEGSETLFRLLSSSGQEIMTSNPHWQVSVSATAISALKKEDKPFFETKEESSREYKMRMIYGKIGPMAIFNMGKSLQENEEYLEIFRNLLLLLIIPFVLFSAAIGWFLSRKALSGLEEVTRTAGEISKGDYNKRVRVKKRSYEIDQLANAFNAMLDRIQALIKGMKEISDNIAHDLTSPLTRIRGIAEITLMNKKTLDDYDEMAASTIEECDTLIDAINTMLDVTEIEAGASETNYETVDLIQLVSDACELFQPIATEKNIKLNAIFSEKLNFISDRRKLQRMVTNLLENSIKYTEPEGTVTVSVKTEPHQIRIDFDDTGIGIPKADLDKIFERFYRCDRSRSQPGIGLGLSLAKAITKSLGGDIYVKSEVNKGSIFSVVLPP